eukprot:12337601-Heterocapsa_arctica.AAC.1
MGVMFNFRSGRQSKPSTDHEPIQRIARVTCGLFWIEVSSRAIGTFNDASSRGHIPVASNNPGNSA